MNLKYKFSTFYYPYTDKLIQQFHRYGIDGILKPNSNSQIGSEGLYLQEGEDTGNNSKFKQTYNPHGTNVLGPHPREEFDFSSRGAYSTYNWELFFYNPMLAAERLSQNQKFEEAQKWYHYVFDPTISEGEGYQRFWRLKPFYENSSRSTIAKLLNTLSNDSTNPEVSDMDDQIRLWQDNPFQPHLIAQMRVMSYMKHTVMKYLDNLIAWGDSLFRQDTMESINEATQLYLLAASILGDRPQGISRKDVTDMSYEDLASTGGFDDFSNKLVQLENGIVGSTVKRSSGISSNNQGLASINVLFFCIPSNKKLEEYWDTVADRLFKIRNCQNIDGVERQLALFAPAIDPLALVKAAGRGGSYLEAIRNLNAPLPAYRFQYMIQRALELTGDVKSLGGALLSALEKKDSEMLAGIRNQHELKVLDNLRHAKKLAIEEANQTIETLVQSKDNVINRLNYYSSRQYMNKEERKQLNKLKAAMSIELGLDSLQTLKGALGAIPETSAGANGAFGSPHFAIKFGGKSLVSPVEGSIGLIRALSTRERSKANQLSIKAGHIRRKEDWDFQAETARIELKQIDKQIEGAYHRRDIALYELELNEKQANNALEIAEVMETKYTNKELYSWMIAELSKLYFRSYQLALDIAKVAERCFQFERLGTTESFIDPYNWDSLKKGLLAGDRLNDNLRRMQQAFDQTNQRRLEMKKNVSVAVLNPEAIIQLRSTGTCTFDIPEVIFDLDFPGHYKRRIKSVSISIPCILGPNGNLPAKLTLGSNLVRHTFGPNIVSDYRRNISSGDDRFSEGRSGGHSIATSTANRDSGLFELNFNDQRYLPFEGAGAISSWTLELPEKEISQFDYETISDIILHIDYEAEDGGKRTDVSNFIKVNIDEVMEGKEWTSMISLKQQFSSNLITLFDGSATDFSITKQHYPYFFRDKSKLINSLDIVLIPKENQTISVGTNADLMVGDGTTNKTAVFAVDPMTNLVTITLDGEIEGDSSTIGDPLGMNLETLMLKKMLGADTDLNSDVIDDILLVIHFEAETAS